MRKDSLVNSQNMLQAEPDFDEEKPQAISHVRPAPNSPFSRVEENSSVKLKNLSKTDVKDGRLKLPKGYLQCTMRHDIMCKKGL